MKGRRPRKKWWKAGIKGDEGKRSEVKTIVEFVYALSWMMPKTILNQNQHELGKPHTEATMSRE